MRAVPQQCSDGAGRAGDHDHLDIKPVFIENLEILGYPHRALKPRMAAIIGDQLFSRLCGFMPTEKKTQ
jgi:hypothetical protein